jgi:LacI family transcriptional regulator
MARVSMQDVAEKAGVSPTTVSHVINKTRFVAEETRRRVLAAIEALDYQPSLIARGLATNSTQAVGLVVSDITNPFYSAVTLGVEHEIIRHGYHTIFCNSDEDPGRENEYLRLLLARQIDGLLIVPTGIRSEHLIRMANADVPIVLLDRETPGLNAPVVCVDNETGAYLATRYLLELGHRRIAVLMGIETISTQTRRLDGYKRALQEAGLAIDESLIARADSRFYTNQPFTFPTQPPLSEGENQAYPPASPALLRLLHLPDPPSAIFVANYPMTLGALHALNACHLSCPGDISLISFDDYDWAPFFSPPLTVVRQPTYRLGQAAAQLLLKLINGEEIESPAPLPVELIVRGSVKKLTT